MWTCLGKEVNGIGHYACINTDTKVTADIKNGSDLVEMQTVEGQRAKVYMFDEANTAWRQI